MWHRSAWTRHVLLKGPRPHTCGLSSAAASPTALGRDRKILPPQLHSKCQTAAQIHTSAERCKSGGPATAEPCPAPQRWRFPSSRSNESRFYECGPVPVASVHPCTDSADIPVPVTVLNPLKTRACRQTDQRLLESRRQTETKRTRSVMSGGRQGPRGAMKPGARRRGGGGATPRMCAFPPAAPTGA